MPNKRYPGKPKYTGQKSGYFTLLHHQGPIVEWSGNVMERVEYINLEKPEHERAIRLDHIVYVPSSMVPEAVREADAKRREADAKWREADAKWREADAKWREAYAKWREADAGKLTAYLKRHVKDCRWNGTELLFGKS